MGVVRDDRQGSTLRAIRQTQGRSLRDVAHAAGINPSALSLIERGKRDPRAGTLHRILEALGETRALRVLGRVAPRVTGRSSLVAGRERTER